MPPSAFLQPEVSRPPHLCSARKAPGPRETGYKGHIAGPTSGSWRGSGLHSTKRFQGRLVLTVHPQGTAVPAPLTAPRMTSPCATCGKSEGGHPVFLYMPNVLVQAEGNSCPRGRQAVFPEILWLKRFSDRPSTRLDYTVMSSRTLD